MLSKYSKEPLPVVGAMNVNVEYSGQTHVQAGTTSSEGEWPYTVWYRRIGCMSLTQGVSSYRSLLGNLCVSGQVESTPSVQSSSKSECMGFI